MLSVMSIGSYAQINRTLKTKVADVLAQMPAKNLTVLDKAMNEIFLMGDEGFEKLAEQLTAPGVGDDTAVRFALNSFARYASQQGKCDVRAFAEKNFLKALGTHDDAEVKTFILNQLNLVASEASIAEVAAYLTNTELCEPATQTLLSLEVKVVAKEFVKALPNTEGKTKATLVRALGEVKCEGSVDLITPLIEADEAWMQKTALAALANIGAPESYKPLLKAAEKVNYKYEATNVAEAFLHYTNRLGEQNELELLEKACKAILKANTSADQLHNASTALSIYAKYLGYQVTPILLDEVENTNKPYRYSILNIAENIGGIADTRLWMDKAVNVNTEVKADIISMLGRRGDVLAASFVKENMESTSKEVREEAIVALAQLKGNEAVPVLINHLVQGNDVDHTKSVLYELLDKQHLAPVAAQLKNSEGAKKAALIDIIGAKSGTQYFSEVYKACSSSDAEVKKAAFTALKNVSSEENLDDLIRLLLSVSDENEIVQTQMAVVAAAEGVESEQEESGKILQALKSTNKKERIISILPAIGGEVALEIVTGYYTNSTGVVKDAAFDALTNWKDYSASKSLYEICKANESEYITRAALSFTRMVNKANLPDDQKLLQYRKIMEFAAEDDKNFVIRSIGQLRTFLSIVYLENYLDNKALQQRAAVAVKDIALQGNFYGAVVRRALEKAASVMQGGDSQYYKIDIQNYLSNMPKEEGLVSIFNGKNLDGWQGMIEGGNPIKIAKLNEKQRAKAQEEANEKMVENWSVKDGKIVFSGKGHNLVSTRVYKDFEMIVDWLITKEGDSGIYLRGTPQVQIWDTSRVEVGAQVGSGGLYNNNKDNVRDPLKVADNPIDEWNTFRITMIGENVTVYLNGELVVDNVVMDNYWNREIPIFESGTIELQAHGNELAFRDVYVREIDTDNIGLTEEEKAEGFVSLFNGKNLDGWQGNKTDYFAENGELIVNPKKGGHGNLFTGKEYSDFNFRFEFRLTPGANNGLGIRAPLKGDAAYVGTELQILDNSAPVYANLAEYQYHGSAYGIIPAKRGFQNPVGEWNSQEVILQGNKIKVILNGEVILDGDLAEASKNGTLDGRDHPGLKRDKGFIGFLGHGSELKFRNLRIKDLSK